MRPDQYGGISGRHGLYLFQHFAQGDATTDDLRKIQFRADFVFQIEFFPGKLIL